MNEYLALNRFTYEACAAAWPIFAVTTVVFCMRTVSRVFYSKIPWDWEDYIISISWGLDVVQKVALQLALNATRKIEPTNMPGTVPNSVFWSLFVDAFSFVSVTLPKIGVAFLLVRIFRPRQWVANAIFSVVFGLFVVCVVGLIITYAQCNPVAGQWDPYTHPATKCWHRDVHIAYSLVASSSSALLDLGFALYPGFVIWNLHLPLWKRLSTMGFMGLGIGAFSIAVVKVVGNASLLGEPTINELLTKALHIALWNCIEGDFVMIAACLPSTRPVFATLGAFTKAHLSASRPTRLTSPSTSECSFGRKKTGKLPDEHELRLVHPPGQAIQVKYDVLLEWDCPNPQERV